MRFYDEMGVELVDAEDYDALALELAEAREQIAAYQVRVDNDALRYARLEEIHNECFGG
jgi:hypothetical protein